MSEATRRAGLTGVQAAERLGHSDSNQVSRWWNARVGLSDQVQYLIGLSQESAAARARILELLGGPIAPPVEPADPEKELARELTEYGDEPAVRKQVEALKEVLDLVKRARGDPSGGERAVAGT